MSYLKVFSVAEVTRHIKGLVESDEELSGIWVRGEISNFNHHSSGHMYFSLKDETCRLRCVMFRSHNVNLSYSLHDGLVVFAYGSIGVYEKSGDYQLYVEMVEPAGVGTLYLAFLQLRDKLSREGLMDPARKRPLPSFPLSVGVVTSPSGAAVRDIISVISRRAPWVHIVIAPALVQGDEAPASIVQAIELLNAYGGVDVLIVGRGGGASEELVAFNDERVARAIAASKVPVISAVGHEIDYTIADLVADRRAPTPSAAAEIAVPDRAQLASLVATLFARMNSAIARQIQTRRSKLSELSDERPFRMPLEPIYQRRQRLDDALKAIRLSILRRLQSNRERLAAVAGRMDALNPLSILKRGYAVLRLLPGHEVVRSVRQVSTGAPVEVLVADGVVYCEVRDVQEARDDGKGQCKGQGECPAGECAAGKHAAGV
ncbi:MAG TPA: exodeoxyribonuclease VII large subunit [Firmicutes bacterium]|nr:exodeoxyribonuclease VII large subunit [Bacillota bacterium]